jgi:phosphoribosylformylglycinamidine synthase
LVTSLKKEWDYIGQKTSIYCKKIADREPLQKSSDVTGDHHRFTFESKSTGAKPMDFALEDF